MSGRNRTVLGSALRLGAIAMVVVFGARGVRAQHLPFSEEAEERGIRFTPSGGSAFGIGGVGIAFVDLDGDLDPDIVIPGAPGGRGAAVYENDGTGNFFDHSGSSGIPPLPFASGIVAGDYDGDGDLDLYISQLYMADVLLENLGGFKFADVTDAAGLGDPGPNQGAAFGDYDGDGWLDIYVSSYWSNDGGTPSPNLLYHNNGDGTFEEVALEFGVDDIGRGYQPVFFDYDQDGDVDLYVVNDRAVTMKGMRNRFWENVGGTFVDLSTESGAGVVMNAMGIGVGDLDANGFQDLYVTNTPDLDGVFLLSDGLGHYVDATVLAGFENRREGWAALFFDFDHDAHLDLFVTNAGPNRLYECDGSFPCQEVALDLGLANDVLTYCAALADIDGDGDLDLLVEDHQDRIRLYVNPLELKEQPHNWLKVKLMGSPPNTYAVGATISVKVGTTTQTRQVLAGVGYKSSSTFVQHFGLAGAAVVDEVSVLWPGGARSTLVEVAVNQLLIIDQTGACVSPPAVTNLQPLDGAGQVALQPVLRWEPVVQATYDVYVGPAGSLEFVGSTDAAEMLVAPLEPETVYAWRVDTVGCATTAGPTWSFMTRGEVDTTSPIVTITAPTDGAFYETAEPTLDLAGTAVDNVGVVAMTWATDQGGSGLGETIDGWTTWSVAGVPLPAGDTLVTIEAIDGAGNRGSAMLLVTYVPPVLAIEIVEPTGDGAYVTEEQTLRVAGTASDDVWSISWSTDGGLSGSCVGTLSWEASAIPLQVGENVITFTAVGAGESSVSTELRATAHAPQPPSVVVATLTSVEEPGPIPVGGPLSTQASSVALSGTALDNVGVTSVTWSVADGASGDCTGTTSWSAEDVPLSVGENEITVKAMDALGLSGDATVTVLRVAEDVAPPDPDDDEPDGGSDGSDAGSDGDPATEPPADDDSAAGQDVDGDNTGDPAASDGDPVATTPADDSDAGASDSTTASRPRVCGGFGLIIAALLVLGQTLARRPRRRR